jgi:hypothetical protein
MGKRTTQGLRDVLFDEIEELRSGKGDPATAQAIASLAKQIINTARIEMDFVRTIAASEATGRPIGLGHLPLGTEQSPASSAKMDATVRSSSPNGARRESVA